MWIFGRLWCRGWLVTDVWISTASILNLCAISIDRYVAVTRPVKYRSIMTTRRAKSIVAAVWLLSFIICFPPLLGPSKDWGSNEPALADVRAGGSDSSPTAFSSTTAAATTSEAARSVDRAGSLGDQGSARASDSEAAKGLRQGKCTVRLRILCSFEGGDRRKPFQCH